MNIRLLTRTPLSQLTNAFNKAFENYFIPLQFTDEGMAQKIKAEGILPEYSIGAFDGDELVGFILHAYDVVNGAKTIYNAGTGVVPSHRGRGLTEAMYRFAVPFLAAQDIRHHLLEVIEGNEAAKRVYEKAGFAVVRKLSAYKLTGEMECSSAFPVQALAVVPPQAKGFCEAQPTWQNDWPSLQRDPENHQLIGVFENDALIGFAAFVPTGRIRLLAVHPQHRRRGIGTALLRHIQQQSPNGQLLATNIDDAYSPAGAFLQACGFERLLGVYEMRMKA